MAVFPCKQRSAGSSNMLNINYRIYENGFYNVPYVLPAIQPSMSKYWKIMKH